MDLDVIWCNFPYAESSAFNPGPKARPSLIIGRESGISHPEDDLLIYVAYGTTKIDKCAGRSILVNDRYSMRDAGVFHPTRFRIDQIALLPFDNRFFPDVPAMAGRKSGNDCRLGALNEMGRRALIRVLREMKADGIDLEESMFAAKKNNLRNSP